MNVTIIKKALSAKELIKAFPLSKKGHEAVKRDRREVQEIISGKDSRLLFIVGPCSAWPFEAALEYAGRLKVLSDQVKDKLKLIMRVYIQKPRTTKGWTGPVNQPDPYQPPDIAAGVRYARSLMIKIIELGLPIADEALFTHNAGGFAGLLSWIAIGARSAEDQEHRVFASALGCPVGMKNPTSGSLEIGVNGVVAAQYPHIAVFNGYQVETKGNPFAHLVLRGGVDGPNWSAAHLRQAKEILEKNKVLNPAIIIDASHDNCKIDGKKDYHEQTKVVREVLNELERQPELKKVVKGFMAESFIKGGNQKVEALTSETIDRGGLSITDPCLSWEETASLITEIAGRV